GKIVAQGRLLLQDTFMVSDPDDGLQGRMTERRVFLFEQLVIFSEPLDKKKGFSLPGFLYKNSIKDLVFGGGAVFVHGCPCFLYRLTALTSPIEYQRNHVGAGSGSCVGSVGAQGGGISGASPGVGGGNSQTSSIPSGPQSVSRRPSKIPQPSRLPQPLRHHTGADAEGPNKMLGLSPRPVPAPLLPPGGSPQGKRPSQTIEDQTQAQTHTPTNTVTPVPRATVGPVPSTPTSKPRPGALSPIAQTLSSPAFGKDALPPPPPSPGQKTGSGFWTSMPASPASRPGSFTFPGEAGETPVRQTTTSSGIQAHRHSTHSKEADRMSTCSSASEQSIQSTQSNGVRPLPAAQG
ncbi:hypothetical protein GOODEAATRI_024561, partial [Goodea atripinnis]